MKLYLRRVESVSLLAFLQAGCSLFGSDNPPEPVVEIPVHKEQAQEQNKEPMIMHQVRSGETLACIAKWYTGSENQWLAISAYNSDVNCKNLKENDVIKIPLDIATSHKEPPSDSLGSQCLQHKKHVRIKTPALMPSPSIETFAPK
ncbi:LysM domain-containing protein [Methylomonas sp. AM2-LC]|uniref:LysM domain-containing protein n=1 Tax=Methylomonas sp. AM2-LC TaxID=3153301 RepID=UPI003264816F